MATVTHMPNNFTPGPWEVRGKQSVRGPEGEYVAKTNWLDGAANARLIAAAPMLLAALERTAYALELAFSQKPLRDMAETLAEARAAIAAATGAQP